MTLTIRSRLTLVYTVVFGAVLVAISVLSYRILAYQLNADMSATLAERTRGLHGYVRFEDGLPTLVFDPQDSAEVAFVAEATRYYQVFDASSGELLVQSDALRPLGLEFTPAEVRQFGDHPSTLDVQTDYGRVRLSNSLLTPAGGHPYLLQVGVSLASMDETLDRYFALLVISVPAGLLMAFFVGGWISRVALGPLTAVADAARRIDISDLRQRLPVRGALDELDDVAVAFNDTLARLEHAVGEMRQFSAALAHELRTPLAALRGDIELSMLGPGKDPALQRRLVSQLEELDKLKRLIDQILLIARAEAGEIPLKMGPVDLGAITTSLVEQLEPVAQAKDILLRCDRADSLIVHGDADWLRRAILNLLDNSLKFTGAHGQVHVTVAGENSTATLAVEDTGIGIEPNAVPRLFERFFRADPARSHDQDGVGLGLSLVKWIVDRHHGRIDVDSRPGHGSRFTVSLPRQ